MIRRALAGVPAFPRASVGGAAVAGIAPIFRALLGFKSGHLQIANWSGSACPTCLVRHAVCSFGLGLAIMPAALLVLGGDGHAGALHIPLRGRAFGWGFRLPDDLAWAWHITQRPRAWRWSADRATTKTRPSGSWLSFMSCSLVGMGGFGPFVIGLVRCASSLAIELIRCVQATAVITVRAVEIVTACGS